MTKMRELRVGSWLLVAALLVVASTMQATLFAEEASPHSPEMPQPDHGVQPSGGSPALHDGVEGTKPSDHAPINLGESVTDTGGTPSVRSGTAGQDFQHDRTGRPEDSNVAGPGGNAASRDPHAFESDVKDFGPIDTRITVQPRRLGGKKSGVAKANFGTIAAGSLHTRRMLGLASTNHILHNAIGLPISKREGIERTIAHGSNGGAPGFFNRTDEHVGNPNAAHSSVLQASGDRHLGSAGLNRAMITGTEINRLGSGLSAIGGSKKTVAGINGTTIRPRH